MFQKEIGAVTNWESLITAIFEFPTIRKDDLIVSLKTCFHLQRNSYQKSRQKNGKDHLLSVWWTSFSWGSRTGDFERWRAHRWSISGTTRAQVWTVETPYNECVPSCTPRWIFINLRFHFFLSIALHQRGEGGKGGESPASIVASFCFVFNDDDAKLCDEFSRHVIYHRNCDSSCGHYQWIRLVDPNPFAGRMFVLFVCLSGG